MTVEEFVERATHFPDGEGPPDPDDAKRRVEALLTDPQHTAPKGPEAREDDLADPAKNVEGD